MTSFSPNGSRGLDFVRVARRRDVDALKSRCFLLTGDSTSGGPLPGVRGVMGVLGVEGIFATEVK